MKPSAFESFANTLPIYALNDEIKIRVVTHVVTYCLCNSIHAFDITIKR